MTTAIGVSGALMSTVATASALKTSNILVGVVGSLAAVAVTAALTATLARRERGTSRLTRVKDQLTGAYLNALEGSPLNPAPGDQP